MFRFGKISIPVKQRPDTIDRNESNRDIFFKYFENFDVSSFHEIVNKAPEASKSKELAHKYLTASSNFLNQGESKEALEKCNRSILVAPHDSLEYKLAMRFRAHVFFEMKEYKECLSDIDLILKFSWCEKLRLEIYHLQSDCYNKLYKIEREKCNQDKMCDQIPEFRDLITEKMRAVAQNYKDYYRLCNFRTNLFILPHLAYGNNPNLLDASIAVDIKDDDRYGRHIIATRNISQGDVLFLEKAFASTKIEDSHLTLNYFCSNCLHYLKHFVPCHKCYFIYCSEKCKVLSWDISHKWECLGVRKELFSNNTILALRATLIDIFKNNNEANNLDFLPMNKMKISSENFNDCIITCVACVNYLLYFTNFFSEANCNEIHVANFGEKLLTHLLQTNSYFDKIKCKLTINPVQDAYKFSDIWSGIGIYPSSSLMNHSCVPNTCNIFYGDLKIVKALVDIPEGSIVTTSYLDISKLDYPDTRIRRMFIKKYFHFVCCCPACISGDYCSPCDFQNAWLCICSGRIVQSSKDDQHGVCFDCKRRVNLKMHFKLQDILEEKKKLFATKNSIGDLAYAYNNAKTILHQNNKELFPFFDYFSSYYLKRDSFMHALSHIKESIALSERIYGDTSYILATYLMYASYVASCYYNELSKKYNSLSCSEFKKEFEDIINKTVHVLSFHANNEEMLNFLDVISMKLLL